MNLGELIARFRFLANDRAASPQWSDSSITYFLNEAVKSACRRARLIQDFTTPSVTQLTIEAGERTAKLDRRVLEVECARWDVDDECLEREDGGKLWHAKACSDGVARTYGLFGHARTKLFLILDRAPTEDSVLYLTVRRLPLIDLESTDTDIEPELAPELHEDLLDWMLHLGYKGRDADASDRVRAKEHAEAFAARFGEEPDVNVERKRLRHRAPVVRPIRF